MRAPRPGPAEADHDGRRCAAGPVAFPGRADPRRSTTTRWRTSTARPIPRTPSAWRSSPPAATAAGCWRPAPTSICCSCFPTSRRRGARASPSTCSTYCGISASRSGTRRAPSTSASRWQRRHHRPHRAARYAAHPRRRTALRASFEERFRTEVVAGTARAFIDAKMAERDARHRGAGESRYKVEPNVKDGKGGLRDLHTLHWLSKYLYGQGVGAATVAAGIFRRRRSRPSAVAKTSCGRSAASCTSSAAGRKRC